MRAALALLLLVGCGKSAPTSSAPSASLLSVDFTFNNSESSKDSHDSIERFRLADGVLSWETETTGYGEDEIPKEKGQLALDEKDLQRLIDMTTTLGLIDDFTSEVGSPGIGTSAIIDAVITVQGKTGRSHSIHHRPWNGPQIEAPDKHRQLMTFRDALATLRERR